LSRRGGVVEKIFRQVLARMICTQPQSIRPIYRMPPYRMYCNRPRRCRLNGQR